MLSTSLPPSISAALASSVPDYTPAPPPNYRVGAGIFENFAEYSLNPTLPPPPPSVLSTDVSVPAVSASLKKSAVRLLRLFLQLLRASELHLASLSDAPAAAAAPASSDGERAGAAELEKISGELKRMYEQANKLRVVQTVARSGAPDGDVRSLKDLLLERKRERVERLGKLTEECERGRALLKELEDGDKGVAQMDTS
jgi:hypothetical protein